MCVCVYVCVRECVWERGRETESERKRERERESERWICNTHKSEIGRDTRFYNLYKWDKLRKHKCKAELEKGQRRDFFFPWHSPQGTSSIDWFGYRVRDTHEWGTRVRDTHECGTSSSDWFGWLIHMNHFDLFTWLTHVIRLYESFWFVHVTHSCESFMWLFCMIQGGEDA